MRKKKSILVGIVLCLTVSAFAELKPSLMFSDNMVLQRDKPVPVWGVAKPGSEIMVTFAGQKKSAVASEDGKWQVTLDSMKANAEPQIMTVSSSIENQKKKIKNVLVGDVWIASGQSNMNNKMKFAHDVEFYRNTATNRLLRFFTTVPNPEEMPQETLFNPNGKSVRWLENEKNTCGACSAVGYTFAREILSEVEIPIGIVMLSKGGTGIECWMKKETLDSDPEFQEMLEWEAYDKPTRMPSVYYNSMMYPVRNFPVKGVLWYQGESNSETEERALLYSKLFAEFVKQWRVWQQNETLPFYCVQIASYRKPSAVAQDEASLPLLRDSQRIAAEADSNVWIIPAIDTGLINNWHPKMKSVLGKRLGALALEYTYGVKTGTQAPRYRSHSIKGNRVTVIFSNVGEGLEIRDVKTTDDGKLMIKGDTVRGFSIYDATGKPMIAEGKIVNPNTIELTAKGVKNPTGVSYAWAEFPLCNVYGKNGMPLFPFREN